MKSLLRISLLAGMLLSSEHCFGSEAKIEERESNTKALQDIKEAAGEGQINDDLVFCVRSASRKCP